MKVGNDDSKATMDAFQDEEQSEAITKDGVLRASQYSSKSMNMSSMEEGDHSRSDHDPSGMTETTSTSADAAKELRDTVIRDEERAVRKVRYLVGTCVALCGIAVTVAVYFLGKARSDQVMFELDVSTALCKGYLALARRATYVVPSTVPCLTN